MDGRSSSIPFSYECETKTLNKDVYYVFYEEGFSLRRDGVAYAVHAMFLTLAVFLASLFAPTASSPIAVGEKIPVFVGFMGAPEPKLIRRFDGEIRAVFHIVNVISANLSRSSMEAVSRHPLVAYVEEIAMVRALQQEIPWGVEKIQAPEAWEITKGAGVKVAILDTGIDIDWNGTELNIKGGVNFQGTAKDGSTDPKDWDDKNGHGTHVAGIVAALDDGDLYVGVAPEVSLYAVKVLGAGGSGTYEDLIQGIEWAVNNSIQIVSMSLSGSENLQSLNDTCKNAFDAGVLLVAASGNDGDGNATNTDPISYPATYDSVIAVGGTDENDAVWEDSSTGPHVELSAPATNIPSLYKWPFTATASGTSMATPHVSGTAALIWAALPTYTNDQVRKRLRETVTDLGPPERDPGYGYGLVNASKAVTVPDIAITSVMPSKTVVGSGYSVNITVVVENQGIKAENFNVTAYYNLSLSDTIIDVSLAAGDNVTLTFTWNTTGVDKGNYTIRAEASVVPDEIDTADNTHIYGMIMVTIPGDVNGDGTVDIYDLALVSKAYGTMKGDPSYNPNADINCDGAIGINDLAINGKNYGRRV